MERRAGRTSGGLLGLPGCRTFPGLEPPSVNTHCSARVETTAHAADARVAFGRPLSPHAHQSRGLGALKLNPGNGEREREDDGEERANTRSGARE
ncbi:hypothetical protein EYF80_035384 [Liparis tanakae]|uniref:Uncharacterized protein n=1 Tax=Liparis tanakae TaxID=230148 RepID=A0A4Z2GMH3_9TELE|nr:hypothetical protein EYF80_035384 [Liparis tanakae]